MLSGAANNQEEPMSWRTFARRTVASAAVAVVLTPICSQTATAHGYAGNRFFPATLATDDPFAASELSLPTVSSIGNQTDVTFDAAIRVLPRVAIGFDETWTDRPGASGFGNLGLSAKWNFFHSDEHEMLLSIGLDTEVGGTGASAIGDDFSTYTPAVFFGKGLGDLPARVSLLRPFAVTGSLGVAIPDQDHSGPDRNPDFLNSGVAIEYSMPYLQSAVKDYGLPDFFNHLIPLVEISTQTGLNRGNHDTTGFVYPGVIYTSQYFQLGVEAQVPLNSASGRDVGVLAQLHFYLDDVAPGAFARPLFGRS
jgi:hypothetical protein